MKILHLITTLENGGAEKQLVILARNQHKLGEQVSVAPIKGSLELKKDFTSANVGILDNLRNVNFLKQIFILRKILKAEHFDLLHLHLPRAEILGSLASFGLGVRLFATRHNAEKFYPNAPRFLSSWFSRLCLLRINNIISISKSVERFLVENKELRKNSNLRIIFYGFDENIEVKTPPKSLQDSRLLTRFVMVARLAPQKNIHTAIRAFARYHNTNPNGILEIYGVGNQFIELVELVQDLQISNSVFFRGRSNEISRVLESSQCLILSSRYEGFGLILLEAMQAGLPLLCARNSAIIEVLGLEHPGFFETFNEAELAIKMLDLNNPTKYSANADYSRNRLVHFNPMWTARETIDFYNSGG